MKTSRQLLFTAAVAMLACTACKKQPATTDQHGDDGFRWTLLQRESLYGAADSTGKEIIPIEFDKVEYYNTDIEKLSRDLELHYFIVEKNGCQGTYSNTGNIIIPTDRQYRSVEATHDYSYSEEHFVYWIAEKKETDAVELCDARGDIVVPFAAGYKYLNLEYNEHGFDEYSDLITENTEVRGDLYRYIIGFKEIYDEITNDQRAWLMNLNGELISKEPRSQWYVWSDHAEGVNFGPDKQNLCVPLDSTMYKTKFDYNSFDGLYLDPYE